MFKPQRSLPSLMSSAKTPCPSAITMFWDEVNSEHALKFTHLPPHCCSGRHHLLQPCLYLHPLPPFGSHYIFLTICPLPELRKAQPVQADWPGVDQMDKGQRSLRKGSGMLPAWLKSTLHLSISGSSLCLPFPATSTMEMTQRAMWQDGQLGQSHSLMLVSVNVQGWNSVGEL